jgi:PadR family transcriptional regulator PadR
MARAAIQPRETQPSVQPTPEQAPARSAPWRQPSRELLTAWLLLLLDRQPTHGYELRRQLHAGGVVTEPGAMYRTLRRLESEGRAASAWEQSDAGPRRRLYQITAKGRSDLDELVEAITVTRDVHAAFLEVHKEHAATAGVRAVPDHAS